MIVFLKKTNKSLTLLSKYKNYLLAQDPRWPIIIEKTFNHPALTLIIKDSQGTLQGSINFNLFKNPFFGDSLISMPYLNGGSISSTVENLEYDKIIDFLSNYQKKENLKYIELRSTTPDLNNKHKVTTLNHKVKYELTLPSSSEELFRNFNKKLRNQIKKPEKAGFTAEIFQEEAVPEENLKKFYQILAKHWHTLGSPIYPYDFFQNVVSAFKNQVILTLIKSPQGQYTSASLSINHQGTVEIIWAATLREYHKDAANMFLYWKNLEYCANQGVHSFDFGRSTKDSTAAKFKAQWGAEEKQLYWHYIGSEKSIPQINNSNPRLALAASTWQKLPLGFCNLVGPKLSKYLP